MVTVSAAPTIGTADLTATVMLPGTDADTAAAGHQVALAAGETQTITVTVTAADGITTKSYAIDVKRPATTVCERTPTVRDVIVSVTSGVNDCADLTAGHLASISELFITDVGSLKSHDFAGLGSLTLLEIWGNRFNASGSMNSLPDNVFDGLSSLTDLTLTAHRLSMLPPRVFSNLTKLRSLALTVNGLASLESGLFNQLTKLTTLNLSSNDLTGLPGNIFDSLTSLTTLNLSSNDLTPEGLPDDIFENLTRLGSLALNGNPGSNSFIPSANAGDGLIANVDSTVMLNGSSSGPWGTNVTYLWAQGRDDIHKVTLADATTTTPTFTAPASPGILNFRLQVTGKGGHRGVAWMQVYVTNLDTTLSGLVLTDADGNPVPLTPAFVPGTRAYSAQVSHAVDRVTVVGTTNDPTAQVSYAPADADKTRAGHQAPLQAGQATMLTVTVTSIDQTVTGTYTISIERPETDVCGRTLQVRNAILGAVQGIADCRALTAANLASITTLDLGSQGIGALDQRDFRGLTGLTTLSLAGNNLTELPAGIFDDLARLATLRLNDNGLAGSLPDRIFASLTQLEILDLNDNPGTGQTGYRPHASAGQDQTVQVRTRVTLDGSSSATDGPWGTNITYAWTQSGGPDVGASLINPNSATPIFIAPSSSGVFTFSLTVTGRGGIANADTVQVQVFEPDTSLNALRLVEQNGTDIQLNPAFASGTTHYTARSGGQVTVYATASDAAATLIYLDAADESLEDASTEPGFQVHMSGTSTVIKIRVTEVDVADPFATTYEVAISTFCGRTEEVVAALVAAVNEVDDCAQLTAPHLASITTLDIRDQDVGALEVNDFRGLTQMTTLLASRANLTTLPDGIFNGLTALRTLKFNGNSIDNLPGGVFDDLTNLSELNFGNNELNDLPDFIFEKLANLVNLNLELNPGLGTAELLPDATAGPDQAALVHSQVSLDGTGSADSSPWGANIAYAWTQTSGTSVTLTNPLSATPTFAAPGSASRLTFRLEVTGKGGDFISDDSIVVTVVEPDPRLSGLVLTNSNGASIGLKPAFAPQRATYTTTAGGRITVNATANSESVISYLDSSNSELTDADTSMPGFQVDTSGDSFDSFIFKIGVSVQDPAGINTYTTTYTVTVNRVCRRTPQIAEALAAAAGVDSCDDLTPGVLATITSLALGNQNIAQLKTGDFRGLTALTTLQLAHNNLTQLPAGVFNDLTELSTLTLNNNNLGGTESSLRNLPNRIFERLTKLQHLDLSNNPGSGRHGFRPRALASSDQTVVVRSPAVTLDGTSSATGGPWGANITYSWRQTAGTPQVALDDANSGTPTFTAPDSPGTLTFELTVTGAGGITHTDTVNVEVVTPDTSLSALALGDADSNAIALTPAFTAGTDAYAATAAFGVTQLTVTAASANLNATITYLDGSENELMDADANTGGFQVAFRGASTVIQIRVSATDPAMEEIYSQTYTVTVTRGLPEVTIVPGDDVAQEGRNAEFTLTLDGAAPAGGLTINVTVEEIQRRTIAEGHLPYDLVAASEEGAKTVAFPAGATMATFSVPTVDDDLYEAGAETPPMPNLLRATLSAGTGYQVGAANQAELILNDGAEKPVPSFHTDLFPQLTVLEGDAAAEIVIVLSHPLPYPVVVLLTHTTGEQNPASAGDFGLDAITIVSFPADTREKTVRLGIIDDSNAEEDETIQFFLSSNSRMLEAPPDEHRSGSRGLTVTIADDDSPGLWLTGTAGLETDEAGVTARFNVVLKIQPSANVVISLESSDITEGTVSPSSLTFTTVNWNTAQHVTLTGQDDDELDGDQDYTVRFTLTSTDSEYGGLTVPSLTARNSDDETAISDATLSNLRLQDAAEQAITLTPAFTATTTLYTASVVNAVETVTVLPVTNSEDATVSYLSGDGAALADAVAATEAFNARLAVGSNTIKVRVTAGDGATTNDYTLAVTRAGANDATLSALTLTYGDGRSVPLLPNFSSHTSTYLVTAPYAAAVVTVNPIPTDANATVSYFDDNNTMLADAAPTTEGFQLNLNAGGTLQLIVRVTAEDENTSEDYVLHITRSAASTDATLGGLALTDTDDQQIALTPTFSRLETTYRASVPVTVTTVTVAAASNDANATVSYLDDNGGTLTDSDGMRDAFQMTLAVGENPLIVRVAAENSVTTRDYAISITRNEAPGTDATLSVLTLTYGEGKRIPFSHFSSQETSYFLPVPNTASIISVIPTPTHANATVSFLDDNGMMLTDVDTASAETFEVAVSIGFTVVQVRVTDENGTTTKDYRLRFFRSPPSENASLQSLEVTGPDDQAIAVTRGLDGLTTTYTASVPFAVTSVALKPTPSNGYAAVSFLDGNGNALTDANATTVDAFEVDLVVGSNTFTVRVTAENGTTTKDYQLRLTRNPPSGNASLQSLGVTGPDDQAIAVTRGSDGPTITYAARVTSAVTSVALKPVPTDGNAAVSFLDGNGNALADANATTVDAFEVNLDMGSNLFTVRVTAEDGNTTKDYSLTITRGQSTIATLRALELTDSAHRAIALAPEFSKITAAYSATVPFAVTSVALKPTPTDGYAAVSFLDGNGNALADANAATVDAFEVDLLVGGNAFTVRVTAEDGATTEDYSLTVTRDVERSTDATLSALTLTYGEGERVPTSDFSSQDESYSADVPYAAAIITVIPTPTHANAMVSYFNDNGTILTDEDTTTAGTFEVRLIVSRIKVVKVRVIAEDGTTTKEYQLRIFRRQPSQRAVLQSLELTGPNDRAIALTPEFSRFTAAYTATVPFALTSVALKPAPSDGNAAVSFLDGNENALTDADTATADTFEVNLVVGGNAFTVRVTAEDGITTEDYSLTITRDAERSTVAILSALELTGPDDQAIALTPPFAEMTTVYTATVASAVTRVALKPTLADVNATVSYLNANGVALADADAMTADAFEVNLVAGSNAFTVRVTAEDGTTTKEYSLTITPGQSTIATLLALQLTDPDSQTVALTPSFAEMTAAYTARVTFAVSRVALAPAPRDVNATVSYLDANGDALADATTADTFEVDLVVGENLFTVRVTAEDGMTTIDYILDVNRAAPSTDATLSGLELRDSSFQFIALNPIFAAATTAYAASVASDVAAVKVYPTPTHSNATVSYLNANGDALADADTATADAFEVNLVAGANAFTVRVTAEDGVTIKDYMLAVTREVSNDATLQAVMGTDDLGNSVTSIGPNFSLIVSPEASYVTVLPVPVEAEASYEILDSNDAPAVDAVADLDGLQIEANLGTVDIKVKVTAPDGDTTATHIVQLTRHASHNLSLSELVITDSQGRLIHSQNGNGLVFKSVRNSVSQITVKAIPVHRNAHVTYQHNGAPLEDADAAKDDFQIDLALGFNFPTLIVTAEAGSSGQLSLLLTRAQQPSTESTLSGLTLAGATDSQVSLSPPFSPDRRAYNAQVAGAVSSIAVVPELADPYATIAFLNSMGSELADSDTSTQAFDLMVPVGETVFRVQVTAEDGQTVQTYAVTITRTPALDDATLASLRVADTNDNPIPLRPAFSSSTTQFTVSVPIAVASITVAPEPTSGNATVTFLDSIGTALADADTNTAEFDVSLAADETTCKIQVTAEDGDTVQTYTLTIVRRVAESLSFGAASYTATEGGSAAVVTVALSADPERTLEVALTVTPANGAQAEDYNVSTETVTFSSGETTREVTVAAQDDAVDDDGETVTLGFAEPLPQGVTMGSPATTEVTLADNDTRGVKVSRDTVRVTEGGSAESYTVVLASQPTAAVTVEVTGHAGTDLMVSPTVLTFTADDWPVAQTVEVSASEDEDALADDAVTLRHAVMGGDYDGESVADVMVTIIETDTPTLAIADAQGLESVGTLAFVVSLSTAGSELITVDYATADGSAVAGEDYTAASGTLTFAAATTASQTIEVAITDDTEDEVEQETFTVELNGAVGATLEDASATGTITDNDDPAVEVAFEAASYAATEGGSAAVVAVALSTDPERTLEVALTVTPANGAQAEDYNVSTETVTFSSGETTREVTVTALDDAVDDDGETVTLGFAEPLPQGVTIASPATTEVTLADNDTRGVRLSKDSVRVTEGGSAESYTVVLASQPTAAVTVEVTGHAGTDLMVSPAALTFTADDWWVAQTVEVSASEDEDALADDAVTLRHTVVGGDYDGESVADVVVTIIESDTPTLAIADAQGLESVGTLAFVVSLNTAGSELITVDYATADGSAVAGEDYTAASGTLTFAAATTAPQTIEVAITDDPADEVEQETFTVELNGAVGATLEDASATGTITDNDDPAVEVAFEEASYAATEGGSAAVVAVALSTDPERTLEVTLTVAPANGAQAEDYNVSTETVTFSSGETTREVTVEAQDDAVDDDGETVTLGFAGPLPEGVTIANPATTEVTLADNDTRGVRLSKDSVRVTEGGSAESYTVVLASQPTAAVTVEVTGHAGTDLMVSPTVLTFTADTWPVAQTVEVSAREDEDALADDAVTLSHAVMGGDYDAESVADVAVTILETDTPTLAIADAQGLESVGRLAFVVSLSTAGSELITVDYATADGSAVSAEDYTAASGTLTFAAGTTASQTIEVAIMDDTEDEAHTETFTVTLSGQTNAALAGGTATGTITDNDDPAVEVAFEAASYAATEGGSAAVVTVALSTDPERTLEVALTVTPANGAQAEDYNVSTETVTFSSGETTREVTVAAQDDAVDDDGETVTLGFAGPLPKGVTIANPATTEVTLADNDTRGVKVSRDTVRVTEGGSAESYTVVLASQPTAAVTVEVTGHAGTDLMVSPTVLTFTADTWPVAQTVEVSAREDEDALADDAVTLSHAVMGGDYDAESVVDVAVTILETDTPTLAIADAQGLEGVGTLVFVVSLSTAGSESITVDYATSDGSAVSGQDYTAASGTLTFAAGTTASQSIEVAITDDPADEVEQETFTVELSDAVGATLEDTSATGTITDNDDPVVELSFGAASYTATEGGSAAVVTMALSADPERTLEVALTAAPASGAQAEDYNVSTETVTFSSGETTREVTVAAQDDAVDDDGETVTLGFAGPLPEGVTIGSPATTEVTLADNDTRGVRLSRDSVRVTEGGSAESYTVVLASQPTAAVTVTVTPDPAATDLRVSPAALTFTAEDWPVAQTVEVSASDDEDALADDAVTLRHTVMGGDYDGESVADVVVTIIETDTPTLAIADAQGLESAGTLVFVVSLSTAGSGLITVDYATADGSAVAAEDYTSASGTLTFAAGATASQTIEVAITDDTEDEAHTETFTVTLSGQTNAALAGGTATGTITDDDASVPTNTPPRVVGTLADRELRVDDGSVEVDISGAFIDAENDTLTYSVESSDPKVATAVVSDATVTVTPVGVGQATVTVRATDTVGDSAVQVFGVAVTLVLVEENLRVKPNAEGGTVVVYEVPTGPLVEIEIPVEADGSSPLDTDGDGDVDGEDIVPMVRSVSASDVPAVAPELRLRVDTESAVDIELPKRRAGPTSPATVRVCLATRLSGDAEMLSLYRYDGEAEQWQRLASEVEDRDDRRFVCAWVSDFSVFAVVEELNGGASGSGREW